MSTQAQAQTSAAITRELLGLEITARHTIRPLTVDEVKWLLSRHRVIARVGGMDVYDLNLRRLAPMFELRDGGRELACRVTWGEYDRDYPPVPMTSSTAFGARVVEKWWSKRWWGLSNVPVRMHLEPPKRIHTPCGREWVCTVDWRVGFILRSLVLDAEPAAPTTPAV